MNENKKAIEIEELSYFYHSDWTLKKFQGLDAITLHVNQGESFGFLGHNGAGKTTTIKCILGLLTPASGQIHLFGKDSRLCAARKSVGYLSEQPYFYDHLSIQEIMEMCATLAGVDRREVKKAVAEALELVKLTKKTNTRMRTLSKGLIQRVAMAQAIVGRPRLLLLDEPFSGLDPMGRKEFADLLFHLKSEGTTIFLSSHILRDVEFLCTRVSIMSQGRLQGIFNVDEIPQYTGGKFELIVRNYAASKDELTALSDEHSAQEVFLRLTFQDKDKAEQALSTAINSSADVESFQFRHGGLEELFVKITREEKSTLSKD